MSLIEAFVLWQTSLFRKLQPNNPIRRSHLIIAHYLFAIGLGHQRGDVTINFFGFSARATDADLVGQVAGGWFASIVEDAFDGFGFGGRFKSLTFSVNRFIA